MEGNSPLKLQIANALMGFTESFATEFNYVIDSDDEDDAEDAQKNDNDKISVTVQTILKTVLLQSEITVSYKILERLVECALETESVEEPSLDIRLKAQLRHTNTKIYEMIQRIQKESP